MSTPSERDPQPSGPPTEPQQPTPAATPPSGTGTPATRTPAAPTSAPAAAPPAAAPPPARSPAPSGPGWSTRDESTTVLPGAGRTAAAASTPPSARPRTEPTRPASGSRPAGRPSTARPAVGRPRRARLSLRRIDPWSVFLFSLVASVFVGIALVVAVAVLYAVLGSLGVTESLNQLYAEVTGGSLETDALLTSGRVVGGAVVLAAVNVVFLTLLATLSAMLFNLCASFTGGIELTFGERD